MYYSEKEALMRAEHRLLRAIGFDVVMPHPQRDLLMLCSDLAVPNSVVTVAVRLMNDTLAYSNLILQYEAGAIAASVLYTALALSDKELKKPNQRTKWRWYEDIGFDVEVVESLGHQIVDMLSEVSLRTAPNSKSM